MYLLRSILNTFKRVFYDKAFKRWHSSKNPHILYKIVDSNTTSQEELYKIQCINTKAIFTISIQDLVFDIPILYGLHPVQGCFIGIEYAKIIKNNNFLKRNNKLSSNQLAYRYGSYNLRYQNRQGFLGFENIMNNEQFLMDPCDIVLSKTLIEEFDVAQAFFIGIQAGFKFNFPLKPTTSLHNKNNQFKHLRLIKG